MKQRYDFSKGERGKFYKPNAVFRLPVYLDEKFERYLAAKAEAKGVEPSELVNEPLNADFGAGPASGQLFCCLFVVCP